MTRYKLLKIQGELVDTVLRADDDTNFNTSIPYDNSNKDYKAYLEWRDIESGRAGNTPEDAD